MRSISVAAFAFIVAVGLVALVLRFGIGATPPTGTASSTTVPDSHVQQDAAPQDEPIRPTSEGLIANALASGDITYEESLLQRAYALFDDPRLQPSFRTRIVNWEAMGALLEEIAEKESTLSKELLDSLLPFRVRPNDTRSIVSRPRAEVLKTQATAQPEWLGLPVPGTDLMVWIQGTKQDLQKYIEMAGKVWKAYPSFFTYPLRDQPGRAIGPFNSITVNPDNRIDLYLIDGAALDPRLGQCQDCSLGTNAGWARVDPETRQAQRASAYLLLDKARSDEEVIDTMAHELAHASQLAYDTTEKGPGAEAWMMESTATWVAYKVLKALHTRPAWEYRLIDRREPVPHPPAVAGTTTVQQPGQALASYWQRLFGVHLLLLRLAGTGRRHREAGVAAGIAAGSTGHRRRRSGHSARGSLSALHRAELESGSRAEAVQRRRRHVLIRAPAGAGEEHALGPGQVRADRARREPVGAVLPVQVVRPEGEEGDVSELLQGPAQRPCLGDQTDRQRLEGARGLVEGRAGGVVSRIAG